MVGAKVSGCNASVLNHSSETQWLLSVLMKQKMQCHDPMFNVYNLCCKAQAQSVYWFDVMAQPWNIVLGFQSFSAKYGVSQIHAATLWPEVLPCFPNLMKKTLSYLASGKCGMAGSGGCGPSTPSGGSGYLHTSF